MSAFILVVCILCAWACALAAAYAAQNGHWEMAAFAIVTLLIAMVGGHAVVSKGRA